MFDKSQMSPDEWQFIRTYCYAVQKHYDLLMSVRLLMDPDRLGVKCPVVAARLATKLHALNEEMSNRFSVIGEKHRLKKSDKIKAPKSTKATPEQVAEIFTISFFKLVDPHLKKSFLTDKDVPKHDGWSSGHPADWQKTLRSLQDIHSQLKTQEIGPAGPLLQALLTLFATLPKGYWSGDDNEEDKYYDEYDYYEDDEYDDEDDDPTAFFM